MEPQHTGLSPRVRGNRERRQGDTSELGSIPASAGEPSGRSWCEETSRVYPRECGGTPERLHPPLLARGLSPRVRGNPWPGVDEPMMLRSIPASAGEPDGSAAGRCSGRVYPRECGGTSMTRACSTSGGGLSPRVRGNPLRPWAQDAAVGSIPASAGEPRRRCGTPPAVRVYPRECGGTARDGLRARLDEGLSPRVRGNRHRGGAPDAPGGSIPASAGEPAWRGSARRSSRVYPRECGGTTVAGAAFEPLAGLSPRVRGNLLQRVARARELGSIPASAGEPVLSSRSPPRPKVYPRECGGTLHQVDRQWAVEGLSPRVRGNL